MSVTQRHGFIIIKRGCHKSEDQTQEASSTLKNVSDVNAF